MCGISGIYNFKNKNILNLPKKIKGMNTILQHRGPDGNGIWHDNFIGLGHTRLSIIDLNERSSQPMITERYILSFNGEIYNYKEIRKKKDIYWKYETFSDSETILALYDKYGENCLEHLTGMFSFAIWDKQEKKLFCARDRFGIKPFYYTIIENTLYFASEIKALFPFIDKLEEDIDGISEYLFFQYPISEKTMFKNVKQLSPGHYLKIENNMVVIKKYWNLSYHKKNNYTLSEQCDNIKKIINQSMKIHLHSDVPISSYVSGGIDSSIVSIITNNNNKLTSLFHGKFSKYPECDESTFAESVSKKTEKIMYTADINFKEFVENINKIIYYLDYPTAGPGSFPQFMISKLASQHTKVILGGQGGDEIFGGYVRYLIPYLEKCINDAIDGKKDDLIELSNHLEILKQYKPLIKKFLKEGTFENLNNRYFHMCDRTKSIKDIVNWQIIDKNKIYKTFSEKFNNSNIPNEDFFNKMLNFDLENSLPALLHVEDRVSMAWGLESRVPFINKDIIKYMASVPENIKINAGNMKYLLKESFKYELPDDVYNRKNKMGFPVPLNDWFKNELKDYFTNCMKKLIDRNLPYLNLNNSILKDFENTPTFSRKYWILFSLELWYENTFDKFDTFKNYIN